MSDLSAAGGVNTQHQIAQGDRSIQADSLVALNDQDSKPADSPQKIRSEAPTDWNAFFAKKKRDPLDVRKLIFQLHEAKRHADVAAAIRAALSHDQAQPWMYEVLVLTLKIEGAPQHEVERALMSQIDFAATDAMSLMLSAAYLVRFDAQAPALRLYRQASDIAPERPEPYLLALKLAQELKDDDALAWAVSGIYTTAWGKRHQEQHQAATNAIADRVRELNAAGEEDKAQELQSTLAQAQQVDLDLRLEWSGEGDLDLFITEPQGAICSFENERTNGGGVYTHDGYGPKQENCFERYVCAIGFPGVYRIHVRHSRGDIVGKRAKLIVTQHKGAPQEHQQEIVVPITDEGEVIRIALVGGRRESLMNLPDSPTPDQETKQSSRRHHGPIDAAERRALARLNGAPHAQLGNLPAPIVSVAGFGAVGYGSGVTVIPSGPQLGIQAVVSPDRRYVRLSLSPSFYELIDVATFQFARGQ